MDLGLYRLKELITEQQLHEVEISYGVKFALISVYRAWDKADIQADRVWLDRLRQCNRRLMITWEPWKIPGTGQGVEQQDFSYQRILSGKYDTYIREFIAELATFPQKVLLRPMHEMNGNWYPWCGTVNTNHPELFIPVWQHMRKCAAEHLGSVEWVWSPYVASYPDLPENNLKQYFPGDGLIDRSALDGYNWGTAKGSMLWQSFDELFREPYRIVTSMSKQPLMIGETASAELGGDKSVWIMEAVQALREHYSGVDTLVWFDCLKECDWRVDSSSQAINAFRSLGKLNS
ncbi:MAG: hypothetical protein ISR96_00930 [Nitrospira sp.]|nr:hypothetical protein [bacterium]MBL7048079.1 hypothetical protein [Nitrospira sp.]